MVDNEMRNRTTWVQVISEPISCVREEIEGGFERAVCENNRVCLRLGRAT